MSKVQKRLDAVWAAVYAANWTKHVKDVGSYGCRLNGIPANLDELVLESLEAANLAVETLKECLDKTKAEQEAEEGEEGHTQVVCLNDTCPLVAYDPVRYDSCPGCTAGG